jgi:hypothetical protein
MAVRTTSTRVGVATLRYSKIAVAASAMASTTPPATAAKPGSLLTKNNAKAAAIIAAQNNHSPAPKIGVTISVARKAAAKFSRYLESSNDPRCRKRSIEAQTAPNTAPIPAEKTRHASASRDGPTH